MHKKIGNANAMEEQSGTSQDKIVFYMLAECRMCMHEIKKSLTVS